jgi:hypothetical protein
VHKGVSKTKIQDRPGYKKFLTLNTTAVIADQTTTDIGLCNIHIEIWGISKKRLRIADKFYD